ncbi:MAG TPA: hypothetical protein PLE48_00075 [Thiobacillus sp.]|nr:MAG: hypothetical protein B7Y50_08600 [Hydrogenophilales bacterium 28-61-11]OYZ56688.1 MAG: hypothetical protein B7Y21_10620 [Hydrogenophilales bacterium 16-61-112]OZA46299.1 MAG: hypothetical protein B7X81_07220 [Hydrogenophilales bacterium 17-61-76]HQT31138.1 hypothetical protein [Thiobacillus sp.]HQT68805.1 hypothetical protein [Thiobacillus sp.]
MSTFDTRIRNAALVTLLCAFAAAQAWAASVNKPDVPDFKAYDQNSDGMVSLEEFVALGGSGKTFLSEDANGDNQLSSDEWVKATASKAP